MTETKVLCHMEGEELPRLHRVPVNNQEIKLRDVKAQLSKGNIVIKRISFKVEIPNYNGYAMEEIKDEDSLLPIVNGLVECWVETVEVAMNHLHALLSQIAGQSPPKPGGQDQSLMSAGDRNASMNQEARFERPVDVSFRQRHLFAHVGNPDDEQVSIVTRLFQEKDAHERKLYERLLIEAKENQKVKDELITVKSQLYKILGILRPRQILEQFERDHSDSMNKRGSKDRQQNWEDFFENVDTFRDILKNHLGEDATKETCGYLAKCIYNSLSANVHDNMLSDVVVLNRSVLSDKQISFMKAVCDSLSVRYLVVENWADTRIASASVGASN